MSFDPYKTKFQIGAARWMARLACKIAVGRII